MRQATTIMTNQAEAEKTFGNPPLPVEDVVDAEGNTYCQVHPDRETGLRCNNCTRLMCAKCAVHTPVGYRCEQCVRQLEDRFFNADQLYYIRLGAITALLGGIGAYVANFIGFWLFIIFIAAGAGSIISEVATRYTKGQRGRYAGEVAAGGVVLGVLTLAVVLGISFGLTAEARLAQQFGPEGAALFIQQQGGILSLIANAIFGYLTRFTILLYTGITAFTVYGRFNIYGGRR